MKYSKTEFTAQSWHRTFSNNGLAYYLPSGSSFGPRDGEVDAGDNAFRLDEERDIFILDDVSNGTHKNNTGVSSTAVGFIGAAVAVLFFGSNLVPIKKADTGDGE